MSARVYAFTASLRSMPSAGNCAVERPGAQHLARQEVHIDDVLRTEHDGPLDDVFQLADVARPVIADEHIEGTRREGETGLVVLLP